MKWGRFMGLKKTRLAKVVASKAVGDLNLHCTVVMEPVRAWVSPSFSSKRWRNLSQTWSHWPIIGVCLWNHQQTILVSIHELTFDGVLPSGMSSASSVSCSGYISTGSSTCTSSTVRVSFFT